MPLSNNVPKKTIGLLSAFQILFSFKKESKNERQSF